MVGRLRSYLRNLRCSPDYPIGSWVFLDIRTFSRLGALYLFCEAKRPDRSTAKIGAILYIRPLTVLITGELLACAA